MLDSITTRHVIIAVVLLALIPLYVSGLSAQITIHEYLQVDLTRGTDTDGDGLREATIDISIPSLPRQAYVDVLVLRADIPAVSARLVGPDGREISPTATWDGHYKWTLPSPTSGIYKLYLEERQRSSRGLVRVMTPLYFIEDNLIRAPAGNTGAPAKWSCYDLFTSIDERGYSPVIWQVEPSVVTVQPGQEFDLRVRLQLRQFSYFPSSIIWQVFLVYSWSPTWPPPEGYYYTLYDGTPSHSGVVIDRTVRVKAPDTPGEYYIYVCMNQHYGMRQALQGLTRQPQPPAHAKVVVQSTSQRCEFRIDLGSSDSGSVSFDVARCSDVTGNGKRDAYVYITVPSGASRLQVTMSVERDDDIDMRLYDPRGSEVNKSTAGTGQNEQITVNNPASGVWKLHVYEYSIGGSTANVRVEAKVEKQQTTPEVKRLEILDVPASGSLVVNLLGSKGYAAEVILLIPSGASELSIRVSPRGESSRNLDVYLYDPRGRTIYEGRELVVSSQQPILIKVPSPMGGEWKLYIRGRDYSAIDIYFRLPVLLREIEIDRNRIIKIMLDRSGYQSHRVGQKDIYTLSIGVYYKGQDKLVGEGENKIDGITLKKALITIWTDRREGPNIYFDGRYIIYTYHRDRIRTPTYMPIDYKTAIKDELEEQRLTSLLTSSLLLLASLGLAQIPVSITMGGQAVEIGSAGSIFDLFNFISGILGINSEEILGPTPPPLDINRYTVINVPMFLAFGLQKTSYVETNFYIEWHKPGVNEVKFWVAIKLNVPLGSDRWIMAPVEYTLRVNVIS